MSTTYPPPRNPLGLPAGSVRGLLTLTIAGLFWILLMQPESRDINVPLYLHALLALVLVFFAAHGDSIGPRMPGEASPLYLPRGTLRILLVAGFVGVIAYQASQHPGLVEKRLVPKDMSNWPFIMLALFGGFLLGWLVGLGPWRKWPAFQDIKAWVALIAMIGLVVELVLQMIQASIPEPMQLDRWQEVLTGIIAFYFGVRS